MPGAQTVIAGKAYVLIEAIDKASKELKQVAAEMDRLGRKSNIIRKMNDMLRKVGITIDMVGRKLRALGSKMRSIGASMTGAGFQAGLMGLTASIPVRYGIQSAREYTDAILSLAGILRSTRKGIRPLEDDIRSLGRSTSFMATEIAQAAEVMARSGMSMDQVRDALDDVLDLARAGKVELPTAATVMSRTLKAFGLTAGEATRVADGLFEASRQGVTTVEELASALSFSSGTAANMGISLEETLGILTTISNAMLVGTKGGTSFNNMLIRMATRGEAIKKVLGFDVFDQTTGEMRTMQELTVDLVHGLSKLSKKQQASALESIFNIRGARSAAAINMLQNDVPKAIEAIKNSMGEANKQRKGMESGLGGMIDRIKSAANDMSITFGEAFDTLIAKFEEFIIPLINSLSKWIEKNKHIATTTLKVIGSLFAFAAVMLTLGIAIKAAGMAFMVLGAAISAGVFLVPILAKVGLLIAAFEVLTMIPGNIGKAFHGMKTSILRAFNAILIIVGRAFTAIKERIMAGDIEGAINILTVALSSAFEMAWIGLKEGWLNFTHYMKTVFYEVIASIKTAWLTMQTWIAKEFLDWIAKSDILNWAFEKFSDVDLQAEIERSNRLGNQGNTTDEILARELLKDLTEVNKEQVEAMKKLTEETNRLKEKYGEQRQTAMERVNQSIKMSKLSARPEVDELAGRMAVAFISDAGGDKGGVTGAKAGQVAALEMGTQEAATKAFDNQRKMVESLGEVASNTAEIAKNTKNMPQVEGV